MTTDKFFFQKFFRRGENDKGGKMTEGITVIIKFMLFLISCLKICNIDIYKLHFLCVYVLIN